MLLRVSPERQLVVLPDEGALGGGGLVWCVVVGNSPLQGGPEVDLVAVHDGLVVLKRRHHGGEALDRGGALLVDGRLDQHVAEVRRPHLLPLGGRVPPDGRGAVVVPAGVVDEAEALVELLGRQLARLHEAEGVLGASAGMRPVRPSWSVRRCRRRTP